MIQKDNSINTIFMVQRLLGLPFLYHKYVIFYFRVLILNELRNLSVRKCFAHQVGPPAS